MGLGVIVDFNAKIGNIEQQVSKINANLNRFESNAKSVSQRVNKALGAIGVGVSVAGIGAFIKGGIDAADALNDMADRTGIAVEKLAGWQHAVKLADTDMQSFAQAANKLSINVAKNAEDFAALGVAAKDPSEAFIQLADVISKIEDPQRRAALANAALGKSYAEMLPLLEQGGNELRQQIKAGQDFSGLTEEMAKKAAAFNDKLDEMSARTQDVRIAISTNILGVITDVVEEMDRAITKSGSLASAWEGLVSGINKNTLSLLGTGGTLSRELDDINIKVVEARDKLKSAKEGGLFSSGDEVAAEYQLNAVLKEREEIVKRINDKRAKPVQNKDPVNNTAIDRVIGIDTGGESKAEAAAKKAQSAAEAARKAAQQRYESEIKSSQDYLQQLADETAQVGFNEKQQQQFYAEKIAAALAAAGASDKEVAAFLNKSSAFIEANAAAKKSFEDLEAAKQANKDISASVKDYSDAISENNEFLQLQLSLVGKNSEEQQRAIEYYKIELEAKQKLQEINDSLADSETKRIQAVAVAQAEANAKAGVEASIIVQQNQDAADAAQKLWQDAANEIKNTLADFIYDPFAKGMDGMLEGFADMLRKMAAQAIAAKIMESVFGTAGGNNTDSLVNTGISLLGSMFGSASAKGNVFSNGNVIPFARGGVVSGPAVFPMAGGRMGLMGEAGAEAIIPLRRDSSGRLGLASGGGGNMVINQNITVGRDADRESVKRAAGEGARQALAAMGGAQRYG